ncbi:hypothetical protein FR932_00030 (plasmid) [Moritella marina ATCC 15381]|uniref:MvaI/BcnI restriction endonuclease domain-containing protein n=1 Tax=Moritella marina ATCC 15381 TaxID=1202962 RepID=A0A5J6WEH6_MORMI|nr:MvaI/BcnI family restriction endonuclease [Moritella marina]QFI36313.1 hypothetical protein FR932_00030 [Moritella marina ATCC 15381]
MCKKTSVIPPEKRLKDRAKLLKKQLGIKQSEALNIVVKEFGYPSWNQYKEALNQQSTLGIPTPPPSLEFVETGDIPMSDNDYDIYDQERENELDKSIKLLVENNKKTLTNLGIEFSIFEPTLTGLRKSILDATHTVRSHFEIEDFHYYWEQGQGRDHKIIKDGFLLTKTASIPTRVSLYRPETKKGDPRMWFKKLSELAAAGDQVAIIIENNQVYLINLSTNNLEDSLPQEECPIGIFLSTYVAKHTSIANELLDKLKEIAKKPFKAQRKGDTAIGYTIEKLLGIEANSSKQPDYKGIELKSGRGAKTRTTMFAQVADWDNSPCKRSADILNRYGYERGDDFKLYCTISTQRENPQGLSFIYNSDKDELQEWYKKHELVAVWSGELLRKRLKEKHAETFWIEAKSELIDGIEVFKLVNVTHTKSPILSQFLPLLESGVVTMDHLIKRNGKTNKVSEKGPLFKIDKRNLDLLFPKPVTYQLQG